MHGTTVAPVRVECSTYSEHEPCCLVFIVLTAAAGAVSEDENGMASSAHVMDDSAALNGSADSAKSHDMGVRPHAVSPRQLADATNLQQKTTIPGTQPTGQTKLLSASSAGRSSTRSCSCDAACD